MERKDSDSKGKLLNFFDLEMDGLAVVGHLGEATEIILPKGVTKIGEYAFHNNESLRKVTLPDSVTQIEDWAFSDCTSLEEIHIPVA